MRRFLVWMASHRRLYAIAVVIGLSVGIWGLPGDPAGALPPYTYTYVDYGPCDGWVLYGDYGTGFANFYENGGGCHPDTYIQVVGINASGSPATVTCQLWVRLSNPSPLGCQVDGPIVRAVLPPGFSAIGLYWRPCEGPHVHPDTCGYPINRSYLTNP